LENATVTYTDDVREQFETVKVIDKGVIIGRIIDGEIVEYGYISKNSIKEIRKGKKREL
jgi:6,7-dimethyl-8-ribityllumazine synthase